MPKVRDKKNGKFKGIVLTKAQLDTVYRLGLISACVREVATVTGLNERTCDDWLLNPDHPFSRAYRKGELEGHVSLRRKQYQTAIEGNITMLIWLGKQRLGQTDIPQTVINNNATVQVDARPPAQVKKELVELQRAVIEEANRLGFNGQN